MTLTPIQIKRRARWNMFGTLQSSLDLFKLAGFTEKQALPHIQALALEEYKQARANLRIETAPHWRNYHKFSALAAIATIVHCDKLRALTGESDA